MIKDELVDLFLALADLHDQDYGDNFPEASAKINAMRDRINNGEIYELGENKTEMNAVVAANYLGVSRPFVVQLCKDGELEYRAVPSRAGTHTRYWIKKDSLEQWSKQKRDKQWAALQELWELEAELGVQYDY